MIKKILSVILLIALVGCKSSPKTAGTYGPEMGPVEEKVDSKNVILISQLPHVRGFSILGFQEAAEEKKIQIKKTVTVGVSSLALTLQKALSKKELEWALLQLNQDVLPHSKDAKRWIDPTSSKKKKLRKLLEKMFSKKGNVFSRLNFDILFFDTQEQRVRKLTAEDPFTEKLIESIWTSEIVTTEWESERTKDDVFVWFKNEMGPNDSQNIAVTDLTTQIDADDYKQKKQAIYLGRQMLIESLRVLENL